MLHVIVLFLKVYVLSCVNDNWMHLLVTLWTSVSFYSQVLMLTVTVSFSLLRGKHSLFVL